MRKTVQFSSAPPNPIVMMDTGLAAQHRKQLHETLQRTRGRRETRKKAGKGQRGGAQGGGELCTLISEMRWEGRGAWCSQAREQPLRSPRAAASGPWARSVRLTAAFTSLLISAAGQRENRKGSHHANACPALFPAAWCSISPRASHFLPVHFGRTWPALP